MKVLYRSLSIAMGALAGFILRDLDWVGKIIFGLPYIVLLAYTFRLMGYAAYAATWAEIERERRASSLTRERAEKT